MNYTYQYHFNNFKIINYDNRLNKFFLNKILLFIVYVILILKIKNLYC